jgi:hypothetical protein
MNNPGIARVVKDVLSQEVDGETVLLNLNNESYFGLDPTGTRIWQLIRDLGDLDDVYAIMLDEFDVSEEQLQQDLKQLVKKLVDAGLVQVSPK